MKVFCANYNGLLDETIAALKARGEFTDNYHEASHFLLWQDVRGDLKTLAGIAREQLGKPVFVLQHGRGATRDYCPPNSFPLKADKILVWGETERDRLLRGGIADSRIEVVGCPLFKYLKPRAKDRQGINILYAPVISSKEEPENLLVHAELKKWEANNLQKYLYDNFANLKRSWATKNITMREGPDGQQTVWSEEILHTIPRGALYSNGLVNVKLTPVHDMYQYQSPLVVTQQHDSNHLETTADLLSNTDVMVCLEEGTMQLLACALDIPVIFVDIFKYGTYGGCENYDSIEKIDTKAVYTVRDLTKLGKTIDQALGNRAELRKHRISVCEADGGIHLGDTTNNIIRAMESYAAITA